MLAFFEENAEASTGVQLARIYMVLLGLGALLIAEQVLAGWIALGERINVLRSDINFIEWVVSLAFLLLAAAALRAAWSLWRGDRAGWPWSQWVSFFSTIIGAVFLMKALLPGGIAQISNLVAPPLDTLIFAIGALLFVSGLLCYRFVTRGVQVFDEKVDKAQGALSTADSDMTPGQFISLQLAQSPSAGAIIGFVFIFLVFSFVTDLFLQPTSVGSVLTNVSTKGIVAIGVTILMISGEFDLSVGSMLGAVSVFYMFFLTEGIPQIGLGPMPMLLAMPAALVVAMLLGFINGIILVRTGIPSFIVTLGTLLIYRTIPLVAIPGGRILRYRDYYDEFPQLWISPWVFTLLALAGLVAIAYVAWRTLPGLWRGLQFRYGAIRNAANDGHFKTTQTLISGVILLVTALALLIIAVWLLMVISFHLGRGGELVQVGFFDLINGRWGFSFEQVTGGLFSIFIPPGANFRNSIIWWLLLVLLFQVVLTQSRYGNSVFAVGGNPGAARAQGINVNRVKVMNFMLVALLVGVTSILEVTRNPGVDPLKGDGWELEVIAMTVIGGALLSGGYGSVIGTLLGALIVGMLATGLVIIGMNARLFRGVVGAITILAVVLNTLVRRQST
ncbi:MAG: ABC transporter permease [Anaerolineaceae bacterium]|nr:ABC transporter permease [Anaerolineaceae bacterium]